MLSLPHAAFWLCQGSAVTQRGEDALANAGDTANTGAWRHLMNSGWDNLALKQLRYLLYFAAEK